MPRDLGAAGTGGALGGGQRLRSARAGREPPGGERKQACGVGDTASAVCFRRWARSRAGFSDAPRSGGRPATRLPPRGQPPVSPERAVSRGQSRVRRRFPGTHMLDYTRVLSRKREPRSHIPDAPTRPRLPDGASESGREGTALLGLTMTLGVCPHFTHGETEAGRSSDWPGVLCLVAKPGFALRGWSTLIPKLLGDTHPQTVAPHPAAPQSGPGSRTPHAQHPCLLFSE